MHRSKRPASRLRLAHEPVVCWFAKYPILAAGWLQYDFSSKIHYRRRIRKYIIEECHTHVGVFLPGYPSTHYQRGTVGSIHIAQQRQRVYPTDIYGIQKSIGTSRLEITHCFPAFSIWASISNVILFHPYLVTSQHHLHHLNHHTSDPMPDHYYTVYNKHTNNPSITEQPLGAQRPLARPPHVNLPNRQPYTPA
jgi:hypothetical protein